jgi:enoyl-CoA hydratase/carnithine racemase
MNPKVGFVEKGRIGTIRIENPPLNVLTNEIRRALFCVLDQVEAKALADVLVIEGAGERAFSVGSDISEFPADEISGMGKIRFEQHLLNRLANLPQVTIAKVGATTLGGGGELMLACDFRIAAAGAMIGFPEIKLGALPAAGGIKRLVQEIGPLRTRQLVLLGRPIQAQEALSFGIINEVVPAAELDGRVMALAEELSALPADALALAKRCIAAAVTQGDIDTVEAESFGRLFRGPNLREGLAAFLEKRKPKFRRDGSSP